MMLEHVLDELVPPRPAPDRWNDVVRAARRPRWPLAVAVVAAAVAGTLLAWPGGTHRTLLERAAAAIGDGPVLHLVIQQGFGGTQIDLSTGARTVVHGREELWYDPTRGIRDVTTFAGVPQSEVTYPPGRVGYLGKSLAFIATDFRHALRNGSARVLGDDTIDGRDVHWIRVDTQLLPDTSDGKDHEWAHDVAVDADTLKPVAARETRDGELSPDGISRIDSIETLTRDAVKIEPSPPEQPVGSFYSVTGTLTRSEADAALGACVIAPDTVGGLPLARIAKQTNREGKIAHTGVTLYYGAREGGDIGSPPPDVPYVRVAETLTLYRSFQQGVSGYSPPDGTVLVFGTTIGVMQSRGVHIALNASSEELLLQAARALNA